MFLGLIKQTKKKNLESKFEYKTCEKWQNSSSSLKTTS